MSNKQSAQLAAARLTAAPGQNAGRPSVKSGLSGANGADKAIPGAAFTTMWYRHPERLMSQSERLPS
ncbi:MAG TPA: hypothetical protein VL984_10230 [Acidimicrobiales bacterium]|nr:hypothetical protein [Acidimicrobiales bacterium]